MGCASDPKLAVVTETETIEVLVEVYTPLPEALTAPLPYPDQLGQQVTVRDVIELAHALYDVLDRANLDRASAKRITTPAAEPDDIPQ